MKKLAISLLLSVAATALCAQPWEPAGDRVKTVWAESLDPSCVHAEYPRPELVREQWQSLNGLWRYALTASASVAPGRYDDRILVPFVPASSLSGVGRRVAAEDALWYERTFEVPAQWRGKKILLRIEAASGLREVWVNGVRAGEGDGLDITPCLTDSATQRLTLKFSDPDAGDALGIGGGVWLEPVPEKYLTGVTFMVGADLKSFTAVATGEGLAAGDVLEFRVYDTGRLCASGRTVVGKPLEVRLKKPKCWTPEHPFLYDVEVALVSRGRTVDKAGSYCALRTAEFRSDAAFYLNGVERFVVGVEDAAWWPDGLRTAPCDAAEMHDIDVAKRLGFSTLKRPQGAVTSRWKWHCDRLGMLVWPASEVVCERFGAMALPLHAHIWNPEKNWGYVKYRTADELTNGYLQQAAALKSRVVLFRQLTDFEGDVTGLQTADRKVLKVDEPRLGEANRAIRNLKNE